MTTGLGTRRASEYDLGPTIALMVLCPDIDSPVLAVAFDDCGAVPLWHTPALAAIAAAEVAELLPEADVQAVPVWRDVVALAVLRRDGRDPAELVELSEPEVAELAARTYVVESRLPDPADAVDAARESRAIARSVARDLTDQQERRGRRRGAP